MADRSAIEWTDARAAKRAYDNARYRRRRAEVRALRLLDPITLISGLDRAYLAGLIDGEGSFYCGGIGTHRNKTCYPIFAIGMTDEDVLTWMAGLFGCSISYVLKRTKNPKWKDQYFVRLSGTRVQILCQILLPYLRVKRQQAELICRFPCDARKAPGFRIAGSEINTERYRLRDQINALNHKPRNPATIRGA